MRAQVNPRQTVHIRLAQQFGNDREPFVQGLRERDGDIVAIDVKAFGRSPPVPVTQPIGAWDIRIEQRRAEMFLG